VIDELGSTSTGMEIVEIGSNPFTPSRIVGSVNAYFKMLSSRIARNSVLRIPAFVLIPERQVFLISSRPVPHLLTYVSCWRKAAARELLQTK
jgi:hypothetical protein